MGTKWFAYAFVIVSLLSANKKVLAQNGGQGIPCNSIENNIPVPWTNLREGDVDFSKRIVRIIDLREKQNQVLQYPHNAIALLLYNAVKSKKLIPYKNDSCTSIYTVEEFLKLGSDTEFVENPTDPNNPDITQIDTVINQFDPLRSVNKLRVVEDWYFDKKHSSYSIRIISIAPVFKMKVSGVDLGDQDLCVFRYYYNTINKKNDIRNLLASKCIYNRKNDAAVMSFDAFFEGRYFSSYIIKVSNQRDIFIKEQSEYKDNGVGAILENQLHQEELMKRESDNYEN